MDMYYSEEKKGFYSLEVHGEDGMPSDAVKLAPGEYEAWGESGGEIAGVTPNGVILMAEPRPPVSL
ncbi:Uncharacterised protein [Achromobacter sp. 2789STDY5608615]|uniref:hypothetical protein n=1 Tax=Achromobacter sp. 2789STDY5608615 TaxID=1806492 RepID=UPI0006C381D9|nr:hypothetical protein [Achromobacter sp. 2789STDY5608615]CUJ98408.1 Uncharacterised protein [Achromobacter sp. 2789STDY5608615]